MGIRFILGRAGSGKTQACLQAIREALQREQSTRPLLFIVPEQATFQTEYAMVNMPGISGTLEARVLSFRRLAAAIFAETGGAAREMVSDLGKQIYIYRAMKQSAPDLKLMKVSTTGFSLAGEILKTIAEFQNYLIRPQDLKALDIKNSEDANTVDLQGKLADVELIFKQYNAMAENNYFDPDDLLTLAAAEAGGSSLVRDAVIWLDGFATFTPQELLFIETLCIHAKELNVALCLDPHTEDSSEKALFKTTQDTYQKLIQMAKLKNISIMDPLLLTSEPPPRFAKNPALAHIEKNFFCRQRNQKTIIPKGVQLVATADRQAEVEAVAREVIRLAREEQYRWREIGVVVRNLDPYYEYFRTVFHDYTIPVFIDSKRPVKHHPLVEAVRAALQVTVDDWHYESVFNYLKTDLAPIARNEADQLEEYVLAAGIQGSIWHDQESWSYRPRYLQADFRETKDPAAEYLQRLNKIRVKAVHNLTRLQQEMKMAHTIYERVLALYNFLVSENVPSRIKEWAQASLDLGDLEKEQENQQIWDNFVEMLDQVVALHGQEAVTLREFSHLIGNGLDNMRLSLIPPALDQVLVGTLDRSRNPNLKAVFILGLVDGEFPQKHTEDGIFTSSEKEILETAGLQLAPNTKTQTYEELYLNYIALTRANSYLWLSYPLADTEGSALVPSSIVTRLRQLFPDLTERMVPIEPQKSAGKNALDFVSQPQNTLTYLLSELRIAQDGDTIDDLWWAVYNWYCRSSKWGSTYQRILASLSYDNNVVPLSDELCNFFYGSELTSSVSRLEKYQACPFAYFAQYVLKLRPRELQRLEALDVGLLLHAALQQMEVALQEEKLDWGQLSWADCLRLAESVISQRAPKVQGGLMLSNARQRHFLRRLTQVLARTNWALAAQAARSAFRPEAWEASFGFSKAKPALEYNLGSRYKIRLRGRIDRVDLAETRGKEYLRVVDYKTGSPKLALEDIFYGINLQLMVYLQAYLNIVRRADDKKVEPAGAFYFRIHEPMIKTQKPCPEEELQQAVLKSFRMPGLLIADPELVFLMDKEIQRESPVVPAAFNNDGSLSSKDTLLEPKQYENLQRHVTTLVKNIALEILSGQIDISPYQKKGFVPCTYCDYKPFCALDPVLDQHRYRILKPLTVKGIHEKLDSF